LDFEAMARKAARVAARFSRKAATYLVEDQRCPVAVLDSGGMDDDAQRQTFGVDERVVFAALQLLGGVVTHRVIFTAPFSADFSDWLSITAALGLGSRPSCSRSAMWSCAQIASHAP